MNIRDGFLEVMANYRDATRSSFTNHALANFIREGLCDAVKSAAAQWGYGLVFKGSAGQGIWTRGPWIGIFNPIITPGAQKGFYPCYLFREDMHGIYLSLNQGTTEAKELYRSDAKSALRARAQNYRSILGAQIFSFSQDGIDLAPSSQSNLTAFYEAGNICSKYYPANSLPLEEQLITDLHDMLVLYGRLIEGQVAVEGALEVDGDAPPNLEIEDATRFRLHKRIERNASLVKSVKARKGHTCEVCGTNFERCYGAIGLGYIEVHHLKPLASLKGARTALNPEKDFAVLCGNCHRMVHRSGLVDDIKQFRELHFKGNKTN
jgi:5-methylcytosine-specific restriction enzyme A